MSDTQSAIFKPGDRVKILSNTGHIGRVVEVRGPFGPGGMMVYRIRIRKKPKPAYVEVREDQLEVLAST